MRTVCFYVAGEFKPGTAVRTSGVPDDNDSNLVDRLLGDIRSGFTNKLGDNIDFSVTKANVDGDGTVSGEARTPSPSSLVSPQGPESAGLGEFTRQGSLRSSKRGSMVANRLRAIEESQSEAKGGNSGGERSEEDQKKVRRSAEMTEADNLFEYLVQAGDDADKALFERQGSLRRRRRRPGGNLDTLVVDRERAPSPALSEETSSPRDSLTKPTERRWRSNLDKTEVDKAIAHHYLERRGSRSPVPSSPGAPSPLVTGEGRVRSFASDSGDSVDKARWSTSSTDTQPDSLEDEAAKERARRRQERKKRSTLDRLDVKAALHKPSESEPNTPRTQSLVVDQSASQRWAEAAQIHRGVVRSESDSSVPKAMGTRQDSPELKTPNDNESESKRNRQAFRYRNNLDAGELTSALKTIEEQSKQKLEEQRQQKEKDGRDGTYDSTPERSRERLARRYQNNIEASAVNAVIQQVEGTAAVLDTQKEEGTQRPLEGNEYKRKNRPGKGHEERRWQSNIERTDVDQVIRSIERTGREIQLIGAENNRTLQDTNGNLKYNDNVRSLNAINEETRLSVPSGDNTRAWLHRRWRSDIDTADIKEALLRNRENANDENGPAPIPPPRTTSKMKRSVDTLLQTAQSEEQLSSSRPQRSLDEAETERFNALRQRLDGQVQKESLTEKAWLKHSTGRWKSNIEKADVDEAFIRLNMNGKSPSSDGKSNDPNSPAYRPVSTYDNVNSDKNHLPELPSTKRWARYYDDDLKMDDNKQTNGYAQTQPAVSRRWSSMADHNEVDAAFAQKGSIPALPKVEDAGYYSLDRARLRRSQSLRISNLRKPDADESLLTTKWRHRAEAQELDQNVQQFQTRVPETERNRRKERFKSLSRRYTDDDDQPWTPSSPRSHGHVDHHTILEKPVENHRLDQNEDDSMKIYNHNQNLINQSEVLQPSHTSIDHHQVSPRSLRIPDDSHLPKSDTDSVASNKDEGFETESMSDPNASQRTSMSSTLESELTGTPTQARKDYSRQKAETPEEQEESRNYFARSIDSLVQRQELATCESRSADESEDNMGYSDKAPTVDDGRLETWQQQNPSDAEGTTVTNTPEDENTEESWTVETVTVERKFSDLTKEEQEAVLASMQLERPPTPPERTTSMAMKSTAPSIPSRSTARNVSKEYSRLSPVSGTPRSSISFRSDPSNREKTSTKIATAPQKPPRSSGASTTRSKPANSVAAAVTARLTRPKKPSATAAAATLLTRHPSNSSVASEASSTSTSSTSRRSTPAKSKNVMKSTLPLSSRDRTSSPSRTRSTLTDRAASPSASPSPFVRGSATRATLPASVLRSNKRAAAEHRDKPEAPCPPQRSSSIRLSERLNLRSNSSPRSREGEQSPGRTAKVAPEASKHPAPSIARPRRSTAISTNLSSSSSPKPDTKVGKLISRLSTTGRIRSDSENDGTNIKGRPKNLALHGYSSTSVNSRPSSGSSSPGSDAGKKDRSPSFLKKIIDKSPHRKSVLNRSDISASPLSDRKKLTVLRPTTKSSKCWTVLGW